MKSSLLRTGLCSLLILLAASLSAQLTPVRIDVRLFQPSVYPDDLAAPGAAVISVTLTDMDRPSLPGYLRLTLSNNSGQEVTTPLVAETLITLTPFNTVTLTGPALERFVRLLGADAGAMNGNGIVLAEGEIVLCAEFYDLEFPFEAPINNADNCSFGFAELHEPPTPLLPVGEEVAIDPLLDAVNFTWAPNYFAGPVINYLIVWDVPLEWTNVTPDIIMSSLEPIRQPVRVNELNALNKVWYNSDADLIPGHRYMYQIQATDPTGRARFRNNGYSRPEFFDYISPTPFTDRLCYEPERLTVTENNGSHTVWWTGYPLDSVNHTITVVTLPERGFVQLSELLTTPTFPARRLINGGPTARFNYDISTSLDTTGGRAYEVALCSVCPLTGEEFCKKVILGTPREPGLNDGPDAVDSTLICGLYPAPALEVTNLTATTATVGWALPADFTGSFVLSWVGSESNDVAADSLLLSAATRNQTLTALAENTEYTVNLCVVCPDGARSCFSEQLLTPESGCLTEADLLAGVAVSALPPDEITVDWSGAFPGSDPNSWRANLNNVSTTSTPDRNNAPLTFNAPAAAPTDTTFSSLNPESEYVITVCYDCPGGSTVCADWTVNLNGIDECLTSLNFTRPDSTDTTLDLAWSYAPNAVSVTDSFTLIWQTADGGEPELTATVAYRDEAFTITDRIPGQTYTLRVCAECTTALPTCRDLPPFGGCVAEYLPELVDLADKRALIGWPVNESPALPTQARYAMRSFLNWTNLPTGTFSYFNPDGHPFPGEQLAETPRLSTSLVYLGQIRTQCQDTLWSAWSEPIEFSTGCSVIDPLEAVAITDERATILAVARANASRYQFFYRLRESTENEWTPLDDTDAPEIELANLLADAVYQVKMRFWCNLGVWSDYTEVLTFRTLPPCEVPENAQVDPILATAAGLEWLTGEHALDASLQYRLVNDAPQQTNEWVVVENLQERTFLSELNGGARYQFRLQSDCGVNLSEWSVVDEFTLLCAPPNQLVVEEVTHQSAQIIIAGLSTTADTHEYSYRLLGESVWQSTTQGTSVATLQNLDDLAPYEVRVRTQCGTGQFSVWSDTLQFETLVDCRVPTSPGVVALSPTTAELRWEVTGTVARWEIRVWDPTIPQQEAPQQQILSEGLSDAEGLGGTAPGSGGTSTPPTPPDPYAAWRLYSVTDPSKVLSGLGSNRKHKVVVRAECPTFGWTDYSDVLEFQTLCLPKSPDTAYAANLQETTAELHWSGVRPCLEDYQVVVESLIPLNLGESALATQSEFPRTETQDIPASPAPGNGTTPRIYRDSFRTADKTINWSGLIANTEYRFRVRARIKQSAFAPEPVGYTTMAAWAASGGANAGAEIVGEASWGPYTSWLTFRTDHCAQPYDLVETTLDRSTMELSWMPSNGVNAYEVKYKLAEDLGSSWAFVTVSEPVVVLENLLSNAVYDYQVTEICQSGEAFMPAPQDTFIMKKPSLNNGFYVCGMLTDVDLSNEVPLAILLKDDTIRAFDFPVVIIEVSGGNGYFSGVGEIRVPFFNKAKMQFEFDNIFVNDEYQMVGGYMEATGFGVEVLPPWADSLLVQIINILEIAEDVITVAQVQLLEDMMALGENANIPPELQQQIQAVLDCFAAAETPADFDACTTLLDNVALQADSFLNTIYDGDFQVTFEEDPAQKYGFDGKRDSEPADWYQERTISGENYLIPFKSVLAGSPETVKAIVPAGKIDSVAFSQPSGSSLGFSPNETSTTETIVSFRGQGNNDYFLVAEQIAGDTTSPKVVGMTKVVPYPELPLHVTLVPVGFNPNLSEATIAAQLKDIFGQAVVNPIVEIDPVFNPAGYEGLSAVSSGLLTNYSPEMRDIIAAYETARDPDENTSYLFLVNDFAPTDRAGFMPRGRQFGFIYHSNAGSGPAYARTLAHELGHGAYVLEHTWEANPSQLEGSTDNLMDYGTGDRLYKWQWDLIHSPVGRPILPGDGDGEQVVVSVIDYLKKYTNPVDSTLTFVTPAGKLITVPKRITEVKFFTGEDVNISCNNSVYDIFVFGSLKSFTLDGEEYRSWYSCNTTNFTGYRVSETSPRYKDTISYQILPVNAVIGFPCFSQTKGAVVVNVAHVAVSNLVDTDQTELSNDYLGVGAREKFAFLATATKINQTEIDASIEPALGEQAKQFMTAVAYASDCNSDVMMYAFTHAHQINIYPEYFTYCEENTLAGLTFAEIEEKMKYGYRHVYSSDEFGIAPPSLPEGFLFSTAEIEAWQTAGQDGTLYKRFHDYIETSHDATVIMKIPVAKSGAELLLKDLKVWGDLTPCVFEGFSAEVRKHILKVLAKSDLTEPILWEWISEEQENVFNYVLGGTPEADYVDILSVFTATNGIFWEVQANMNDPFIGNSDKSGYEYFISQLGLMYLKAFPSTAMNETSYSSTGTTEANGLFYSLTSYVQYAGEPIYATILNPDIEGVHNHYRVLTDSTSNLMQISNRINGIFIEEVTITKNPFEYVAIRFLKKTKFSHVGGNLVNVEAGTVIMVPMFLARMIVDKLRDADLDKSLRQTLAVIGILVSGPVGIIVNGAKFIVYLDVAYNVVDALVLANDAYEYETTGSSDIPQDIHKIWDVAGLFSLLSTAHGVLKFAGKNVTITFSKFGPALADLRANRPSKVNLFNNKLKETYHYFLTNQASFTDPSQLLVVMADLKAEICGSLLRSKVTNIGSQYQVYSKSNLYAAVRNIQTEVSRTFANGNFNALTDDYVLTPIVWAPTTGPFTSVTIIENVKYVDNAGDVKLGTLEIGEATENGQLITRVLSNVDNLLANQHSSWYSIFQQKNWDFNQYFTQGIGDLLTTLTPAQKTKWQSIVHSLPDGQVGVDRFSEVFAEIFARTNIHDLVVADEAGGIFDLFCRIKNQNKRTLLCDYLSPPAPVNPQSPSILSIALNNTEFKVALAADPILFKAFDVLADFPTFRTSIPDLQVLNQVAAKMEYGGEDSYRALVSLFSGSASKRKILDNLLFAKENLPLSSSYVKLSGIKSGPVKFMDTDGNEMARITNGQLELRKFTPNGTAMGDPVDQFTLVRKTDGTMGYKVNSLSETALGASFDYFINSVKSNFDITDDYVHQAFYLYSKKNWPELENLINSKGLNGGYPPAKGGFELEFVTDFPSGLKYDRYQEFFIGVDGDGNPILTGSFLSPLETPPLNYPSRALRPPAENGNAFYYEVEVLQPLGFSGESGKVIPWFGKPGGASQTKWNVPVNPGSPSGYPYSLTELAEQGKIRVTIISAPSGNSDVLPFVGTILD